MGSRGDDGIPIATWDINWSGIEKWWIMDKLFKSISFRHVYNGKRELSINDENNDGKLTNDELQNEQYSLNYSPIIGITTRTIGRNYISFNVKYYHDQTISKQGENLTSTEHNYHNLITSEIKYSKKGGFKIPIFFLRDFYIDNDIDFSLNFNWDTNLTRMSYIVDELTGEALDFNEHNKSTVWSLSPYLTYKFSKYVTGNIHYEYKVTETMTSGKTEENDFGFHLRISIRG
jgi:hypothetical protein